jgi:hypothetical protein
MSSTNHTVKTSTEDARALLRAKLGEQRIRRSSKHAKDRILEQTLKQVGIDKKKLQEDMEAVKKQGGLTIEQSRKTHS